MQPLWGRCSRRARAPSRLKHVCSFKAQGCCHTLLIRPRALRRYLTMSRTTHNSVLQLADLMRHRLQNRNQQMHLFIIYTQPDVLQRETSPTTRHMKKKKVPIDTTLINPVRSVTSHVPKRRGWSCWILFLHRSYEYRKCSIKPPVYDKQQSCQWFNS